MFFFGFPAENLAYLKMDPFFLRSVAKLQSTRMEDMVGTLAGRNKFFTSPFDLPSAAVKFREIGHGMIMNGGCGESGWQETGVMADRKGGCKRQRQ